MKHLPLVIRVLIFFTIMDTVAAFGSLIAAEAGLLSFHQSQTNQVAITQQSAQQAAATRHFLAEINYICAADAQLAKVNHLSLPIPADLCNLSAP